MITLGLIGYGSITKNLHIPGLNASGKFYIKAAADPYADEAAAKEAGIPDFYRDYKEMLADPEISAVLIASPHDCHEEHAVAAFKAGKHVLLEKPIARNLSEAKNIVDAAEESGKFGMAGFCHRFRPMNDYIKKQIEAGNLGKLVSARIDHYQNFRANKASWWCSVERSGGGAVIGSGIHRLDLLRWFFGEPVSVYAKTAYVPERLEGEACAHAVIEFPNDVIVNFSINWACYDYMCRESLSVTGTDGSIWSDGVNVGKISLASTERGKFQDFDPPVCPTMYEQFADCIENGTAPECNLMEGYNTLKLIRAIYLSAETGKPVTPDQVTV